MEVLQPYMVPIIVAICFGVGYCIKKFTPEEFDNKYIPAVLAILGIILNSWNNGFAFTPEILAGGIASGLAATGVNELLKVFKKEDK